MDRGVALLQLSGAEDAPRIYSSRLERDHREVRLGQGTLLHIAVDRDVDGLRLGKEDGLGIVGT